MWNACMDTRSEPKMPKKRFRDSLRSAGYVPYDVLLSRSDPETPSARWTERKNILLCQARRRGEKRQPSTWGARCSPATTKTSVALSPTVLYDDRSMTSSARTRILLGCAVLFSGSALAFSQSLPAATPRHRAVEHDDLSEVARLIRAGSDVNALNRYGAAPIRSSTAKLARNVLPLGKNG
jgi:hypothetical protein